MQDNVSLDFVLDRSSLADDPKSDHDIVTDAVAAAWLLYAGRGVSSFELEFGEALLQKFKNKQPSELLVLSRWELKFLRMLFAFAVFPGNFASLFSQIVKVLEGVGNGQDNAAVASGSKNVRGKRRV